MYEKQEGRWVETLQSHDHHSDSSLVLEIIQEQAVRSLQPTAPSSECYRTTRLLPSRLRQPNLLLHVALLISPPSGLRTYVSISRSGQASWKPRRAAKGSGRASSSAMTATHARNCGYTWACCESGYRPTPSFWRRYPTRPARWTAYRWAFPSSPCYLTKAL